ncbi:hypothetical protein NP233_g4013 [Leucocoprinus birnbaumii]|uniref:Smr domain-containing protein n=1 Tax=Leucocoprinus birnbaumii TaxID=56174 RepID=A0AAD5YVX9_9AGAR|nr:hypothetical protein NP233_g4013 [Leucocoprinus birnbaumii]
MSALFQTLEKEFCPPLDSSLLAALLAEIEPSVGGQSLSPDALQVDKLRLTLQELAAHAEEVQLSEFAELNLTSPTEDTVSSRDLAPSRTTANTSVSSGSSSSSEHSFSSPLGFLQASLPDVSTHRLKKALQEIERKGRELDMWDLVASILSEESIRELEERGLDALDDDVGKFREEDVEWEVVSPKSKKHRSIPSTKRKRARGATKITLVDIRQQNHGTPQTRKADAVSKPPLPDLWTQVQSIATNISTYLSPHPPSFFQSYLHSPRYETPYQALLAAIESICTTTPHGREENPGLLFNLLDILLPEYEPLDSEKRSRLVQETELCIRATNGRGEDVIDLVKILRELDSDASSGKWELGIYHLPPHKPPPSPIIAREAHSKRNSLSLVSPPTTPRISHNSPALQSPVLNTPKEDKTDPYQWQTVPVRTVHDESPRLAQSIPAYARASSHRIKGSGNGFGKGGKGDVGELSGSNHKVKEHRRRQEEYLRQAAKMWQRGDKKTRGGEIAFYYAEKAREFQEMAKQEALENARIMVDTKRSGTGKHDEIDLHGTTVFEAVTIVKETLRDFSCSPSQPLKIITGKGTHSTNKVGVLKPAIKNALLQDGWIIGMASCDSDSDASFVARKRRKFKADGHKKKKKSKSNEQGREGCSLTFDPLLYPPGGNIATDDDLAFDETVEELLPELLRTRASLLQQDSECDDQGTYLRPLTRSEISSLLISRGDKRAYDSTSALLMRKLRLSQERRANHIVAKPLTATVVSPHPDRLASGEIAPKPQIVQALEKIQTTPFESSFISRLQGTRRSTIPGLIAVDWETVTPWMSLMNDIRDHYKLAHTSRALRSPERTQPMESLAPITYCSLQACQLNQIHDLLERVFWTGIDVSDSLEFSPERCTVVACYARLVVGVAIMSSPQETYITYLAVRAGWDKASVARNMLFHLIKMNPRRDITLHVSVNNSAMLLYNQFGFKAEEFIAGFYEDYLDPVSRASKNAFRLRLRQ